MSIGKIHETHLPTIDHPAQADARLSRSYENPRGPRGRACSPSQGARAFRRLTRVRKAFSFTRARRLEGPDAFAAVFAYQCRVNGKWFQVYAKPNDVSDARLGVVVSKRTMPRAVDRNYCKRLVREVFRAERGTLSGIDFVVWPRIAVTRDAFVGARAEARDLLRRVRAQCEARSNMTPLP